MPAPLPTKLKLLLFLFPSFHASFVLTHTHTHTHMQIVATPEREHSLFVIRVVFRRFLALLLACGHSKLAGRRLGELQELHDAVHCLGRQSRQVLGLAHFMALEHVRGEGFCHLWGERDKEATKKMRGEREGEGEEEDKETKRDRYKIERRVCVCERKMNKNYFLKKRTSCSMVSDSK